MKAVNFHNVLEHNNKLHITSGVGSHFVSWYLLSIQENAVNLLRLHKEVKSFY